MSGFATSRAHLLAELDRLDALLRLRVWRARHGATGVAASQPEGGSVDALFSSPGGLPGWSSTSAYPNDEWPRAWDALIGDLTLQRQGALRNGVTLRVDEIRRRFGLTAADLDILLLGIAAEIDVRYEEAFAFFNGDSSRRRLTVDLALNLICASLPEKLDMTARFFPDAPLLRHRLVRLVDDPNAGHGSPWLAHALKVDERVVRYLLDSDEVDPSIASFVRRAEPSLAPAGSFAEPLVATAARALMRRSHDRSLIIHLREARDGDGPEVARSACQLAGLDLLVVDGDRLAGLVEPPEVIVALLAREAVLRGCALYIGDAGAAGSKVLDAVVREQDRAPPHVVFVSRDAPWEPAPTSGAEFLSLEIALPNGAERLAIWQGALAGKSPEIDGELEGVAGKFRFSEAQIRSAVAGTIRRSRWAPVQGTPTIDDLYAACRAQSSHAIDDLARRIRPHYQWHDIVLPTDALQQLREVCERVTHRGRVLDQWGFAGKLSLGRGLNVLFAGPSGTGKTMAAEIMAGELRLDLFRIDLSSVVSKYIGETEKNLSKVFAAAETSNAILFFDEADALFGKRSEVKDAHDRYANVETSYLLQRMEEYAGITILATNLRRNLDDAFARRMAFTITFPVPEEDERLRIWRKVWPEEMPRDAEIDLPFMAKQFKLSGGNIKNIAVAAAFLAASDGGCVAMRHIVRATRRELQKLGKTAVSDDFGPYANHDAA